jgi:hypothetical protein
MLTKQFIVVTRIGISGLSRGLEAVETPPASHLIVVMPKALFLISRFPSSSL